MVPRIEDLVKNTLKGHKKCARNERPFRNWVYDKADHESFSVAPLKKIC